jgi:hypothetical protein
MSKPFKIAALISTLLLGFAICIPLSAGRSIISESFPGQTLASVANGGVGISTHGLNTSLLVWSGQRNFVHIGPWWPEELRFDGGDSFNAWGVSYFYTHFTDGSSTWQLSICYWYFVALFSALPIVLLAKRFRQRVRFQISMLTLLICTTLLGALLGASLQIDVHDPEFASPRAPTTIEVAWRLIYWGLPVVAAMLAAPWLLREALRIVKQADSISESAH